MSRSARRLALVLTLSVCLLVLIVTFARVDARRAISPAPMAPQATIFNETVGTPGATTAIGSYTGWSNNGILTFTGTGDVRTSTASSGYAGATGSGNVFLTNSAGTNFQISGINTTGYTSLALTAGVFKSTTASNGSDFTVEVSTNGTTYTPLAFTAFATGSGTAIWRLVTFTGTVPATQNLRIRFTNTGTTTQYRIDDVILTGTLSCPTLFTVNDLGDASDAAPGDGACATAGAVCTLRAAIEESQALTNCGSPIDIHFGLTGTINLGNSLPTITRPVNIIGNGANALTIAGNDTFRLINILLGSASTMSIKDLTLTHGRKAAGANAAAIEFNNNGTLNLDRIEFVNNSGPSAGAADGSSLIFSNASAVLNITGCTLQNNQVEHVVHIGNTPFNITNSTISNNTGTGAAVFIFGGVPSASINYSTIANNNQGIWHANSGGASSVTIKGTLLSQNGNINLRRTPGGCPATTNQIISAGHNLIDDSSAAVNLCTVDPTDIVGTSVIAGLATLSNNGGTTQTRALNSNSAAIDGGAVDAPTLDQRGAPRVGPPDIGAFENQGTTFTVNALTDTGAGSGLLGDLRYCVTKSQARDNATINFTVNGTINLGSSLPQITRGVTFSGPGANLLTVAGNDTFQLMGILLATPATVNINDLSFSNGRKTSGVNAAAIEFNNNGTLNLNRIELFNNSGPSAGAADGSSVIFTNASAALNLTGCTIRNNSVEHVIVVGNTPFNLTNSTISNNTGTGAAFFIFGGVTSGQFNNCTIANNNQGIWHANGSGTSAVGIKNTLLSQNGNINLRRTPGGSSSNQLASGGFNLVDDASFSQFNASQATDLNGASFNPQLGALAYNGGPTRTRALLTGSAAIDKGGPGVSTDQRGLARPFDNTGIPPAAGGNNSDIGAFEQVLSLTVPATTLANGGVGVSYSQTLNNATGGTAPYSFVVTGGALPGGLTLDPSTRVISGSPTATGTFNFSVTVTDSLGAQGTQSYSILVGNPLFRSAADGNWNANSTWQVSIDGVNWIGATSTPTSASAAITIRVSDTVTVTANTDADQLTIDAGGNLIVNNGVTFTIANGTGTDLTVNGGLATSGTITNNGQITVNGVLTVGTTGNPAGGPGSYVYDPVAVLNFTNTGPGSFAVNNVSYWPTVSGPQTVRVLNSGGITMNVARTVVELATSAGVSGAGNLTVTGLFQLNAGGFVSGSPTYGAAALLKYNTGGSYGRAGEWLPGVTSGAGYPANVQLSNGTTLDLPNGSAGSAFQMSGNLTIDGGSTLLMAGGTPLTQPLTVLGNVGNSGTIALSTATGGELRIRGNYSELATGTLVGNGPNLVFEGAGAQTISDSTGALSIADLNINKSAGTLQLTATDLTVTGTLTLTAGTATTGASTIVVDSSGDLVRTSGFVIGNLRKNFGGAGAFTYAVGTTGEYTPVDVTVTGGSGSLRIAATKGQPPVVGPSSSIQRYWTLTGGGITANLNFNYLQSDVLGNEANYRIIRISGGNALSFPNACPATPCVDPASNTAVINGVQNFSDWTVGENFAPTAAPAELSGQVFATPGGRPFRNVQVSVRNLVTGEVRRTVTDAKGRYVFAELPTGVDYLIQVSRPGYTFIPDSRLISHNAAVTNIDFIGGPEPSLSPPKPTGPKGELKGQADRR